MYTRNKNILLPCTSVWVTGCAVSGACTPYSLQTPHLDHPPRRARLRLEGEVLGLALGRHPPSVRRVEEQEVLRAANEKPTDKADTRMTDRWGRPR